MLIFLFGFPGSGKNFVGEILRDHFGFFFYDGDELLTLEMKEFIKKKDSIPDNLLKDFMQRQEKKFFELKVMHKKLVLAQPLPQKPAQKRMALLLPEAIFVRIIAPMHLIAQRLKRREHFVDSECANQIIDSSEEPDFLHKVVCNDGGKEKIKSQLIEILNIT